MAECGECGGHVTAAFARVFGDDDGTVWRCYGCAPRELLVQGGGADPGRERRSWVDIPHLRQGGAP